jgi:hypothetical protein
MKTAGYDIVLLLNEHFLNQVSGALFYNNFLTFNDNKDFSEDLTPDKLDKIPASLHSFLKIRYRFKLLHEPFINFKANNKIEISAKIRVYIWMLDGLEIKFDSSLMMETPLAIDAITKEFKINLSSADIKQFDIHYQYSPTENVLLELDNIFENALHAYFNDANSSFSISLPSLKTQLPYAAEIPENQIPIDIKALKTVNSTSLVLAANLFGYNGGNSALLYEFVKNCNIGIGVSEMAMKKFYNFFWERTTWDKTFYKAGTFNISMVDKALDFLTNLVDFIMSTSVKIASLGFLETELNFLGSEFVYELDIDFRTKPTFDLQNGNKVAIYNLGVDLFIRLKMKTTFEYTVELDTSGPIPDKCTPWDDDIVLSKTKKTVQVFDIGVPIKNLKLKKAVGKIVINDEEKMLECEVLDLDINIFDYVDNTCAFLGLPQFIRDKIVNGMKNKLLDSIPPIALSPVFDLDIKMIDWKLNIEGRKLHITNHEAVIGAFLQFKELQNQIKPVPKYIANTNTMEVHRSGCDSIYDIYETHQEGYYILQNALKKKYDGCKKCLPGFHKR